MSEVSVRLNAAELAALAGLPSLAVVAYVLGVRPWMDYRTGLVGIVRGISWQSIREAIEVAGRQGMKRQTFTEEQARRAVAHLEKAGLLKRQSTKDALIFAARLATRDSHAQIKPAPMPAPRTAPARRAETYAPIDLPPPPDPKPIGKPAPKPAPPPAVTYKSNSSSSTTYRRDDDEADLIFHQAIKPEYREQIKTSLQGIEPEQRQAAVDELAGCIVSRAGTANPIRSQLAYLRAIVDDIRAGGFVKTHAADIERARINEAARKERDAARASEIEKETATAPRFRPGVSLAGFLKSLN